MVEKRHPVALVMGVGRRAGIGAAVVDRLAKRSIKAYRHQRLTALG